MTQYHSEFDQSKNKLNTTYNSLEVIRVVTINNKPTIKSSKDYLIPVNPIEHSVQVFKKQTEILIDTTPIYYDLYNFLGITYQSGSPSPTPSSAYEGDEGGWLFKYPIEDFRVPQGQTPFDLTAVPNDQWEYQNSIAVINQSVLLSDMPEYMLNYIKIKSFLYNDATGIIDCPDFGEIYRWHKEPNGFSFNYNAFFTVEQENNQVLLKASLILSNPLTLDSLQQKKLS